MDLLRVENLTVSTKSGASIVKGVSFGLGENEILGVVGESGCGKSTMAKALMGLHDAKGLSVQGNVWLDGSNILDMRDRAIENIRGKSIGFIPQNPMSALNPLFKVGRQMVESIMAHGCRDKKLAWYYAMEILESMGFDDSKSVMESYPHQLSGGMLQRVIIGIAVSQGPRLIIADEPTTALDSFTKGVVVEAIMNIRRLRGISVLYISHDCDVIKRVSDNVMLMECGRVKRRCRGEAFSDFGCRGFALKKCGRGCKGGTGYVGAKESGSEIRPKVGAERSFCRI